MPLVAFDSLSDESRVWVFAADPPLDDRRSRELLAMVDAYLDQWTAHDKPLTCGREWRDNRFLVVGVDQSGAHASGCSIDGLYRKLAEFEKQNSVSLLSRDPVFYRDSSGDVHSASRDEFARLSSAGGISGETKVFDTSIGALGEWRGRFELPAAGSWHRALLSR